MKNKTKRIDPVTHRVLLKGESIRYGLDGKIVGYEFKYTNQLTHKRKSIFAKTLTELREREKEVMSDIAKGLNTDRRKFTLNDLFDEWYPTMKYSVKGNTYRNYGYMYDHFCRERIGRRKVTEITKTDILAFYKTLYETDGLKINTIDIVNNILTQLFDKAIDDELIIKTPMYKTFKGFRKANRSDTNKQQEGLTKEELELFKSFLANSDEYSDWYPIFMIANYLGLRCGELCSLQTSDFDLNNMTVSINKTLVYYKEEDGDRSEFHVSSTKTKKSKRVLPLDNEIKELVERQLEYNKKHKLTCTKPIDGYSDFVFLNRFGSPYMNSTLNKALKRIVRDCNFSQMDKGEELLLPNIHMHTFRHTFSNMCYENGVSLKAQSELLGHSSISISQDVYTNLTINDLRGEMSKLFS